MEFKKPISKERERQTKQETLNYREKLMITRGNVGWGMGKIFKKEKIVFGVFFFPPTITHFSGCGDGHPYSWNNLLDQRIFF